MFNKLIILLSIVSLCFISGCANKRSGPNRESTEFVTDIRSDGSKRFNLYVKTSGRRDKNGGRQNGQRGQNRGQQGEAGRGGRGGGSRDRGGQRGDQNGQQPEIDRQRGDESAEETREKVIALVEQNIAESGFCRNGYIELDYTSISGETQFRGECQESASAEDKARW